MKPVEKQVHRLHLAAPRALSRSLIAGAFVGLAVAGLITFLDWRLNPGGVFRDAQGTNWAIVLETGMSWFLPVFGGIGVIAFVAHWVVNRIQRRSRARDELEQT